MEVVNYQELISFNPDAGPANIRKLLIELYQAAVNSVDPRLIIPAKLNYNSYEKILKIEGNHFSVASRKLWILGVGKAVGGMAEALENIIHDIDYEGVVCVPEGLKEKLNLRRIRILQSSHPFPSEKNIRNTDFLLKLINQVSSEDLVIFLLSGGGSAMLTAPIYPITLDDMIILNKELINCGMSIHEMNVIRKHISEVKGGKLANKINCETITLILSDVIGDKLESIASGPLTPDPSTFSDSKSLLIKYNLWEDRIPDSIKDTIQKGLKGEISDTSKKESEKFNHVHSYIIGSNRIACNAVLSYARKRGLRSIYLTDKIEGDARWLGKLLARIYSGFSEESNEPLLIVSGGETTIKVRGDGIGGRNQEVAASLLNEISSNSPYITFAFISAGTDGIDGNSEYAGALVDNHTIKVYWQKKVNLTDYQKQSDTCNFFKQIGGSLILTGPTGTNVMDIHISIVNTNEL
ncbi:MAG: glycerate kinase type-2 family protein [Candidatus Hodarchaeales archaeon]